MFAITGVTGQVGGHTARALLDAGQPVRAILRGASKGRVWADLGAEVAIADFDDTSTLAAALDGVDAAFVLLPTDPGGTDASHRAAGDRIAVAVATSGVPRVVMLSSVGADLAEGTGPIRWLHHLENRLRETGTTLTVIRSPHFQEKVTDLLDPVTRDGFYPVFGTTADRPIPMVATADIGAAVAHYLQHPPTNTTASTTVVDLQAPAYTERDVATALATAFDRTVQVVCIPRADWLRTLTDTGIPGPLAQELVAMYEADDNGRLQPVGEHTFPCTTTLEDTLPTIFPRVRTLPRRVNADYHGAHERISGECSPVHPLDPGPVERPS